MNEQAGLCISRVTLTRFFVPLIGDTEGAGMRGGCRRQPRGGPIMRYVSAWTYHDCAGVRAAWTLPWTPAFDRIKTVSKRDPF